MNDFKVGQQVELITDPGTSPLYKRMLSKMNNPTRILGTIVYMTGVYNILIHSNQLEEYGLGHSGSTATSKNIKLHHEKGYWWVGASGIKPYHEQPSFSDLDKLDKLFKEENNE